MLRGLSSRSHRPLTRLRRLMGEDTGPPTREGAAAVADQARSEWAFEGGQEIVPGRHALQPLGGGHRYEVYLVWDERLFAVMVAKIVRPDLIQDEGALRGLRRETEALRTGRTIFLDAPGDDRRRIMLRSSEASYRHEVTYPWDNYFNTEEEHESMLVTFEDELGSDADLAAYSPATDPAPPVGGSEPF
jgi:hypothetical protein